MATVILKRLRKSEFGWFQECRDQGREVSRVRGLNMDAEIVRRVFRPGRVAGFEVVTKWHDGFRLHEDRRPILLQAKNWRLTGTAVPGRRFGQCEDGDIIVMAVTRDDTIPVVTWDIVHRAGNEALAQSFGDALRGESMRALGPKAGEALLEVCRAHLLAFGAAPIGGGLDTSDDAVLPELTAQSQRRKRPSEPALAPPTTGPGDHESLLAKAIRGDVLEPDLPILLEAFRSIGYGLGPALADLVDNSINAKARKVRIRIERDATRIVRVVVADDGTGIDESTISEAMRFGTRTQRPLDSLGKFGFGMKLASFSACRSFTVATRQRHRAIARRWTATGIIDGWRHDVLDDSAAASLVDAKVTGWALGPSGTAVIWDDIDRLDLPTQDFDRALKTQLNKVKTHLGLTFHKFLVPGGIALSYEIYDHVQGCAGAVTPILPLDPFAYARSGLDGYPKQMHVQLDGIGPLALQCHVWPPGMKLPEYKLDGANMRQGLYVYRNQRLIQAGGWSQLRTNEAHLSLARVAIELPPTYDAAFKLDVQKTSVKPPAAFELALKKARAPDGTTFDEYLQHAQGAYRNTAGDEVEAPLTPGDGLPEELIDALREELAGGDLGAQQVAFEWAKLGKNEFFQVVRADEPRIVINQRWRRLLGGRPRLNDEDAPIIKVLLYLLLEKSIRLQRVRDTETARLERLSRLLAMTCQHMADEA